jgi:uncharacterized protein YndB with AHSA1/START domain
METKDKTTITIGATIQAPVEKVWDCWTNPKHIVHWNNASDDWHTPRAENDLRAGGKFLARMEAKDGSYGFDFSGVYDLVKPNKLIAYTLGDDRRVKITFTGKGNETEITEAFEAENTNSLKMQQEGWQAILDNFKKYVEASGKLETMNFEVLIDATPEKVYDIMLDDAHYQEWTAEFMPTSRYEGSWEKGSKILFIGEDQDGNSGGMVSRIKENIPNRFVSIEHLGMIQNGKEITSGPEVEGWAGALENYTFTGVNNKTLLSVEMDANQQYKSYFLETWPKALNKLKAICETR